MKKKHLIILAVVATVALAGCLNGDDDVGTVDNVPDQADFVMSFDADILEDDTTERLVDASIEMEMEDNPDYDGPESYDEWWNEANEELETDLDPRDFDEAVFFGELPDDPVALEPEAEDEDDYFGFIASAGWDEDELLEEIRQEGEVDEGEYNGVPFYTVTTMSEDVFGEEVEETTYAAVLGDGIFAAGESRQAVEDTVDVAMGDAEPLSGDLRDEYDRISDGYINFVADAPDLGLDDAPEDEMFDVGAFEGITVVSGSYFVEGDDIGMNANLRTDDEGDATDIEEGIDGILSSIALFAPEFAEFTDPIEVTREDTTVVMSYQIDVDELIQRMEEFEDPFGTSDEDFATDEDFGQESPDDFGGEFDEEPPEDDFEEEFEEEFGDEFGEPMPEEEAMP